MSRSARLAFLLCTLAAASCSTGFGVGITVDMGCAGTITDLDITAAFAPGGGVKQTMVPAATFFAASRRFVVIPPAGATSITVTVVALDQAVQVGTGTVTVAVTSGALVEDSVALTGCPTPTDASGLGDLAMPDLAAVNDLVAIEDESSPVDEGVVDLSAVVDMALPSPDLSGCTPKSCGGPTPYCDQNSGHCVQCIGDDTCPEAALCMNGSCVAGCSISHGCGDAGICLLDGGACFHCVKNGDCGGNTPFCNIPMGVCSACLIGGNNCMPNYDCKSVNGVLECVPSCVMNSDCPKNDAGMPLECCSAHCVNFANDINNCLGCDVTCSVKNGSPACVVGQCAIEGCNAPFTDCDHNYANGCEVNLNTDPSNCGACKNVCNLPNANEGCSAGMCTIASCKPGFSDCNKQTQDGCETNTGSDLTNCGVCGTKCPTPVNASPGCANGACSIGSCDQGFADCDHMAFNGCEIDTDSDVKNCGVCGKQCLINQACAAGVCK